MVSIKEEYDKCWANFYAHFPHLQKPFMKMADLMFVWGLTDGSTTIVLNESLKSAELDFIHHVIYHEMCHFIYPHHERAFYDLLKQFSPMQIEENKKLSQRVVELKQLADELTDTI